ncbi:hypothetical protein B0H11DRAFT_2043535 [Mycena galericulata]|nr:hypothetical protein B0H11DRAFT_2043535 [Mycena galericulata]
MVELPQELIDAILEVVPGSSLRECSLTASSFVHTSQRRIFRALSLSEIPAFERMAIILTESPHLGQYVRHLSLQISHIPSDWAPLKRLLSTMPTIERLAISGVANESTRSQIQLNPSLLEILSLRSLRCVALDDLGDVPGSLIIQILSSFEEVSLSSLSIVNEQDEIGDGSSSAVSGILWHLSVTGDPHGTILPFLIEPRRLGHLSRLTHLTIVRMDIFHDDTFLAFLVACSPVLEYLELEVHLPLVFPQLPALYVLELWIPDDAAQAIPDIVLPALTAIPYLECLTIAIVERPAGQHIFHWDDPALVQTPSWQELDVRFVVMMERNWDFEPSLYERYCPSPLREVEISLRGFSYEPERFATFVPNMKAKLPLTLNCSLLAFSYQPAILPPMDRFSDAPVFEFYDY